MHKYVCQWVVQLTVQIVELFRKEIKTLKYQWGWVWNQLNSVNLSANFISWQPIVLVGSPTNLLISPDFSSSFVRRVSATFSSSRGSGSTWSRVGSLFLLGFLCSLPFRLEPFFGTELWSVLALASSVSWLFFLPRF